jgi:SAM-dependent methyltransferase
VGETQTQKQRDDDMRRFWDERARQNALWYIHSQLDFRNPDIDEFWRSGDDNLTRTMEPFGVHLHGHEHVLEIGCGVGRMTRALAARSARVVGIDVSEEMVQLGRQLLADIGNIELLVGTGRDLHGLDNETFDVCYSFIVFQHIPDPSITLTYIREMGRVLRRGGWALFQISESPTIHDATYWRWRIPFSQRLGALLRRAPGGCLRPEWLGSSLPRRALLEALTAGGLDLDRTTGDGTQYCFVLARKPQPANGQQDAPER